MDAKCPVSGAAGLCPMLASHRVLFHEGAQPERSGNFVRVSELPEAQIEGPSEQTKDDLAEIKSWPRGSLLSAEDIVVVKGAWNRTIAFKDAMMEA